MCDNILQAKKADPDLCETVLKRFNNLYNVRKNNQMSNKYDTPSAVA